MFQIFPICCINLVQLWLYQRPNLTFLFPPQFQGQIITKAMGYIESKVSQSSRPLALATAAYALTLAGSPMSDIVFKKLMEISKSSIDGQFLYVYL